MLLLVLGGMEDCFGKTDSGDVFGSDAVQYLDCARALGRGDWHTALNPLWSQGYPALLALARPLFHAGPWGDWLDTCFGIFCLDLMTFSYLTGRVLALLRSQGRMAVGDSDLAFRMAALAVFAATQLCLGPVSRVGPDELVSALFFLACGLLLRTAEPPLRFQAAAQRCALRAGIFFGLCLGSAFWSRRFFCRLAARCCCCLRQPSG